MNDFYTDTQWYYARDALSYGPYDTETIRNFIEEGIVNDETLFWHSGFDNWMRGRDIVGLFPSGDTTSRTRDVETADTTLHSAQSTDTSLLKLRIREASESQDSANQKTFRTRIKVRAHTAEEEVRDDSIPSPNIPNLLPWSIIATFVCCFCFPFGILAIVYSIQANIAKNEGDYVAAQKAVNVAKVFLFLTVVLGGLLLLATMFSG